MQINNKKKRQPRRKNIMGKRLDQTLNQKGYPNGHISARKGFFIRNVQVKTKNVTLPISSKIVNIF